MSSFSTSVMNTATVGAARGTPTRCCVKRVSVTVVQCSNSRMDSVTMAVTDNLASEKWPPGMFRRPPPLCCARSWQVRIAGFSGWSLMIEEIRSSFGIFPRFRWRLCRSTSVLLEVASLAWPAHGGFRSLELSPPSSTRASAAQAGALPHGSGLFLVLDPKRHRPPR